MSAYKIVQSMLIESDRIEEHQLKTNQSRRSDFTFFPTPRSREPAGALSGLSQSFPSQMAIE